MIHRDVTAAILRRGDEILVCGRAPGSLLNTGIEFPGGKREEGETLPECLKRECLEELGIRIVVLDQIWQTETIFGDKHLSLYFFRVMLEEGSPEPEGKESQMVKWVRIDSLPSLNLLPADRELGEFLASGWKDLKKNPF